MRVIRTDNVYDFNKNKKLHILYLRPCLEICCAKCFDFTKTFQKFSTVHLNLFYYVGLQQAHNLGEAIGAITPSPKTVLQ